MAEHEEVEFEDLYSDRSGKEEQTERLLKDGDTVSWPTRRSQNRWQAALYIFGAMLAGAGLLMLVALGLSQETRAATQEVTDIFGVRSNDYILDNAWDVDAPAQRREYRWTIRDWIHNPDGIFRPMILVNNEYPGPLIEANDGDTIVVHVENRAINATSIHWHGLYQNSTPWMDGTVGVTQCPIAPGQSFTYEFTIKGQHGTTWWHGHQGVQTSDGLHGPIVIHSRKEKELQRLQYDTDRVVLLSDHYHDLSSALMFQYLMPDAENAEPVPESVLINGRAIRNCEDFPHRKCDNTTADIGPPILDLAANQRHRLRLINVGAFAEIQFQIDEHELAVTEVDGTDVHPQTVHRLDINPAQRYSVIVNTDVVSAQSFWMRATMIEHCFTEPPKTVQAESRAVIRYDTIADTPSTQDWGLKLALECRDMNTSNLHPVEVISPPDADTVFYLRSNFEIGAYRLSRGFWNTSSWRADVTSPGLHRALQGLQGQNNSFEMASTAAVNPVAFDLNRELVIQTTGIQTIDILVSNFDDGEHPLHLHGYKFFVLAQGHGAPPLTRKDAAINKESLQPLYNTLNTTNPLRRDTASVEAFGWILLRIVADNPGMWAFHCHVSWHAEAGLLMTLLTRSDELAKMQIPQQNLALCSAEGLNSGMAPDDSVYADFA